MVSKTMIKRFRVLVVDDDQRVLRFLKAKLKASGYDVFTASDGPEALELVQDQQPDLVVLDLLMPKMHGIEVLKQLRSFSTIPVIILSAIGADTERIKGLQLGADDYIAKPFNPEELVARIEAVKRRLGPEQQRKHLEPVTIGNLIIDFGKHRAFFGDEELHLTRIEWLLLSELSINVGRLMTYEDLLTRVWGPEYRDDIQLLRTWVSRLRHKLEELGESDIIDTIPKTGYIIRSS